MGIRGLPVTMLLHEAAGIAFFLKFGNLCRIFLLRGDAMPTLQRFGAYKIEMFFADHLPPHVHVTGPDFEALVRIADATVFKGDISHQYRKEALS